MKLAFANQLRGVAACMVVLAHYTVVVHMLRPDVAWVIGAPPLDGPVPAIARWVHSSPVDIGTTAVAVFFLISGFVIPFSLDSLRSGRFLVARAWRILPTFWGALAVEAAVVMASAAYWQRPLPYHWPDYLVNGLLLETWTGRQTVDWVSWTLSVEVKFYLLAALLRPFLFVHPIRLALACAAASLAINIGERRGLLPFSPEFVSETIYLPYILIGAMFHAHFGGRLSRAGLASGAAATLALVGLCWWGGPLTAETSGRSLCLLTALAIFAACYGLRGRFRPNRVLDGLAAVSYPLYLTHSLLGFPLLPFLMLGRHVPYAAAATMTLTAVGISAVILHQFVELPTTRLGHRLARTKFARLKPIAG